jgi:hypothetical protein
LSCGKQHIDFTVKNESETTYDSIVLVGLSKIPIYNFEPYSTYSNYIDNSNLSEDNECEIITYQKGNIRSRHFGLFNNNDLSAEAFIITILKDTINIRQTTAF